MPPNQLPQATIGFPPPCQLGCASPCYVYLLFSSMEHSSFLCSVTMIYAHMLTLGSDENILIPIMYYVCISHGHFSYLRVCNLSGPFLFFKDFLSSYKNLAYEINLIFFWLMFSEGLKLKFELEKVNNKFILRTLPCPTYSRWTPLESRSIWWSPGGVQVQFILVVAQPNY